MMSESPWAKRATLLKTVEQSLLFQHTLEQVAKTMTETLLRGNTVFIAGNGGSAAEAQHFSAEIVGRFKVERRGYRAIALSTDTSALTAIGNDYGFDTIFSRQIEALAREGDMFFGISTSGVSPNIIRAAKLARTMKLSTVGLAGRGGGGLGIAVDHALIVPSDDTALIQEVHLIVIHMLCEYFDAHAIHY